MLSLLSPWKPGIGGSIKKPTKLMPLGANPKALEVAVLVDNIVYVDAGVDNVKDVAACVLGPVVSNPKNVPDTPPPKSKFRLNSAAFAGEATPSARIAAVNIIFLSKVSLPI
jgi:hypothetical protein